MITRLLLLVFLVSCGTLTFVDDKKLERKSIVSPAPFVITGTKEFYLFGTIPSEHVVNVTEEFVKRGYLEVSKVSYNEFTRFKDQLMTIITFGFYSPTNYVIRGVYSKGLKKE